MVYIVICRFCISFVQLLKCFFFKAELHLLYTGHIQLWVKLYLVLSKLWFYFYTFGIILPSAICPISCSAVKSELTKHCSVSCIFSYKGFVNLCRPLQYIDCVEDKFVFLFIVYIVTVHCRFLLSFVYLLKIFGLNWTVVCFISVLLLVVLNATCIYLTVDFYITAKFFKSCEFFVTTELLYTYP